MKRTIILVSFFLSILTATYAYAATINVGEKYTLPLSSIEQKNMYVAAGTAVISGSVSGDVSVAAGDITVSGKIGEDALLAGGTVDLVGDIAIDARIIGGKVTIGSKIGKDSVIAGGAVSFLPGSKVLGDVILAGGKVSLLGEVYGNVYVAGGDVFIGGKVAGNVRAYSGKPVRLGPGAVIGGDFYYHSSKQAVIEKGAVINGKTIHDFSPPLLSAGDARSFFAGVFGVMFAVRILMLAATALLLVLVFRRASVAIARLSLEKYWKMTLVGLAVFLAMPFVGIVVAVTVFGVLITVMIFALWILLCIIAQVYAGVVLSSLIRKYLFKKPLPPTVPWYDAVLGVLGIGIMLLIPYIGVLSMLILFFAAFGSLSDIIYKQFIVAR